MRLMDQQVGVVKPFAKPQGKEVGFGTSPISANHAKSVQFGASTRPKAGGVDEEATDLGALLRSQFNAAQAVQTSEVITLNELYRKLLRDPAPALSAHQRLYRAIMHEGEDEPVNILGRKVRRYKAFTGGGSVTLTALRGVEEAHEQFMNLLRDGLDGNEKGRRAILLLGGPGSGKTETVNICKRLLAESTKTFNPVYSLKWVDLPPEILKLGNEEGEEDTDPKLSNPLLLFPREVRQAIQTQLNEAYQQELGFPVFTLTEDELSGRSAKIRDLLVKKYLEELKESEPDLKPEEALLKATEMVINKHARAQRVVFREDQGIGYVEGKDPNHFDATVISGDVHPAGEARYGTAQDPRAFDYGRSDVLKGNGGLVHFDEMLKTKDTHLQSLLQIAQEGRAKGVAGIREKVNTVLLGTSNLAEYLKLRRKGENSPLFERISVVKFRYPRNYKEEIAIYKDGFEKQARTHNIYIAPHALETAALFAVMTRLTIPSGESRGILPVKADLYAGEFSKYPKVPQATVAKWKAEGETNYEDESKEEGFTGISTRLMRDFLTAMKNSQFIGDPTGERTLDGFAMIKALRYELENNGLFKLPNVKLRQEYEQVLNLAQARLDEAVSEDVKAVIESDDEQLQAAFENYTRRVIAWSNHANNGMPFDNTDERGLKENLERAERNMTVVEEQMGLRTKEAREAHRHQLASKLALNQIQGKTNDLDSNPSLKKALLAVLTRSMQVGIPYEALKTTNPDAKQKEHQERFYTKMAQKGYNRTAALNALECYQRVYNRQ